MKLRNGFTLLEMMLVLVIVSALAVMAVNFSTRKMEELRRDRATMQIQQILNAGLAFYINNGRWPTNLTELQNQGYVAAQTTGSGGSSGSGSSGPSPSSPNPIATPWGGTYVAAPTTLANNVNVFQVTLTLPAAMAAANAKAEGSMIAGRVPFGTLDSTGYIVTSSVNVPGQNLNNARSVNFAAVYHSGACVPAPTCPSGMTPQIMVIPAAVNGVTDAPNCTNQYDPSTCSNVNLYSINSFTAFAVGDATTSEPVDLTSGSVRGCSSAATQPCNTVGPPGCGTSSGGGGGSSAYGGGGSSGSTGTPCTTTPITTGKYWRVCLGIGTDKGAVTPTTSGWGLLSGSVMAITRCAPGTTSSTSEPSGSSFQVWQ